MIIEKLKNNITKMFPIVYESNYIDGIKKVFDSYNELIKDIAYDDKKRITDICNCINSIIKMHNEGQRYDAINKFHKLLNAENGVFNYIKIMNFDKSAKTLYHIRRKEKNKIFTFNDMFHIPLEQRGIVQTHRFNTSGYPCLYLGNSIFDCWIEMDKPDLDDIVVSGYKVDHGFSVYDIRIPSDDEYNETQLINTLYRLPLIFACSVRVNNCGDYFKPEYIIPQMLTEAIIRNNKNNCEKGPADMPWDIMYTSTRNEYNDCCNVGNLHNVALPVVESNKSKGYCSVLATSFKISDPIDVSSFKNVNLTLGTQKEQQSYMQYIESLIEKSKFQSINGLYINEPNLSLIIPSDGSPVSINIVANCAWKVE